MRDTTIVRALALATILGAVHLSVQAQGEAVQAQVGVAPKVLVGEIDGEITLTEAAYVKRLVDTATREDYAVLALRLNTFGGRVDAAVAIRDALLDLEIPSVVWIDRRAISAGALISLACTRIAMAEGGTIGAAMPITAGPGAEAAQPVEEKILSYFRQEMRSTAEARGRNGDIAEAMVDADKEIDGVSEKGKLLTLTTTRALELGFADIEAKSLEEALAGLELSGTQTALERSWAEQVAGLLTSSAVASLLLVGMLLFGYLEFQTPGFGIFGFTSITCFLLLYFGHTLVNLAGWEELLLFAIGAILLAIELFVLPGFGIVGVLGALSILIAAAMVVSTGSWTAPTLDNPFTERALVRVSLAALTALVMMVLAARFLPSSPNSPFGGRLVLARRDRDSATTSHPEQSSLVGARGQAVTPLRPTGKAIFVGIRRDVVSEAEFLDAGTTVEVLRISGAQLVVRRVRVVDAEGQHA